MKSLFGGMGVYLFINVLYVVFIIMHFLGGNILAYHSFVFYFDASYAEFKLWFPRFYLPAYLFVVGVKAVLLGALLILLYLFYQRRERLIALLQYNNEKDYIPFIRREGGIAFIALVFYLALYYLSAFFLSQALHNDLQIVIARGFLLHIIFQILVVLTVHFVRIRHYLQYYLLTPSLPHNIAILRILFFIYLIYVYGIHSYYYTYTISLATRTALPYIGWLVEFLPVNILLYKFFLGLGIMCCVFIVIGYRTRFFLVLNAVCVFYIVATPNFFGQLWHHQLIIWISWFFAFSRCYDVFSIDARLSKTPVVKSPDYTFPVRFVWLSFGIIYFWAGFYKLWDSGFEWALGNSMINQVQLEWAQNYDKIPAVRIDRIPLLLHLGGLAVILFELSYFIFVLRPKLRWIAAIGGLLMHNFIGYFMYISFSHFLQAFYVFYIDFGKWFEPKNIKTAISKQYSKLAFSFGVVILVANFLCGMLSIDSYPFSAYPKYSMLIPDTLKIIQFDAVLSDGALVDIHAVGEKNHFRWENYGWYEYDLIRDYEEGKDVSEKLKEYWQIWTTYNPELKQCKRVSVSIVERPVKPEGKNQLKTIHLLGALKL